MNDTTSYNEILIRIHEAAKKHSINLTYTNIKVYLKLLEYAEENVNSAGFAKDIHGVRFYATTLSLADYCSVAPRTITESLHKLNACGIITYVIDRPNPSVIKLFKKYYD